MCTGYKGDMVRNVFESRYRVMDVEYSQEAMPLGTGGALRFALPAIHHENILAMNGDSYVKADISDFLKWYLKKECEVSLLLTKVPDTSRYGRVEVDGNGRITNFQEKTQDSGCGYINAGIYLLKRRVLLSIPYGKMHSLETDLFHDLVKRGLFGYKQEGEFIDIGTPRSYSRANLFFSGSV